MPIPALHQGWKKEREVGSYTDGRIVMVAPKDPPHAWKKVDNVLSIVDAELGVVGIGVRKRDESKVSGREGGGGLSDM